jgi:hypothetical protein
MYKDLLFECESAEIAAQWYSALQKHIAFITEQKLNHKASGLYIGYPPPEFKGELKCNN